MIYLDSSALVKLALAEPETAALARWLADELGAPPADSADLPRPELPRGEALTAEMRLGPRFAVVKRLSVIGQDEPQGGDSGTFVVLSTA